MKSEDLIGLYMKSSPHLDGQRLRLSLILEKRKRDIYCNFKLMKFDLADLRDNNSEI